ncbi:hypothetical protein RHS01_08178 [Rhizoctonia solani]|uniref:Uncharacterized protein n=1 Tax=Rhizoctonia solani TaxID=456999 RepID=A0A8H7M1T8_9AGAM|nr:hypothetical protein RHS01_08178 [Rhizoctonia solani]
MSKLRPKTHERAPSTITRARPFDLICGDYLSLLPAPRGSKRSYSLSMYTARSLSGLLHAMREQGLHSQMPRQTMDTFMTQEASCRIMGHTSIAAKLTNGQKTRAYQSSLTTTFTLGQWPHRRREPNTDRSPPNLLCRRSREKPGRPEPPTIAPTTVMAEIPAKGIRDMNDRILPSSGTRPANS